MKNFRIPSLSFLEFDNMSERYYDHVISRTSPWVVNNGNIKVVFDNLIANGNCHSINTRISSFAWSNNQSSSVLPNEFGLFFSKLLPLVVPVQTVRSFRSLSWTWNRKINEIQVPKSNEFPLVKLYLQRLDCECLLVWFIDALRYKDTFNLTECRNAFICKSHPWVDF